MAVLLGEVIEQLVDLPSSASIDAARWLVDDQHLDTGLGQPAGKQHLLLIAPEIDDVLLGRRRRILSCLMNSAAVPASRPRLSMPKIEKCRRADDDVLATESPWTMPSNLRSSEQSTRPSQIERRGLEPELSAPSMDTLPDLRDPAP